MMVIAETQQHHLLFCCFWFVFCLLLLLTPYVHTYLPQDPSTWEQALRLLANDAFVAEMEAMMQTDEYQSTVATYYDQQQQQVVVRTGGDHGGRTANRTSTTTTIAEPAATATVEEETAAVAQTTSGAAGAAVASEIKMLHAVADQLHAQSQRLQESTQAALAVHAAQLVVLQQVTAELKAAVVVVETEQAAATTAVPSTTTTASEVMARGEEAVLERDLASTDMDTPTETALVVLGAGSTAAVVVSAAAIVEDKVGVSSEDVVEDEVTPVDNDATVEKETVEAAITAAAPPPPITTTTTEAAPAGEELVRQKLIMLISSIPLNRSVQANQEMARTILRTNSIAYEILDGVEEKDLRNELFKVSGRRGEYPQFFLVTLPTGTASFWGGWDEFSAENDNGTIRNVFPTGAFSPRSEEDVVEDVTASDPAVSSSEETPPSSSTGSVEDTGIGAMAAQTVGMDQTAADIHPVIPASVEDIGDKNSMATSFFKNE
jgi:hypothetical protein